MSSHQDILSEFRSIYGSEPDYVVRAPGRINLIGEHTDYNQGWVLPAAIDKALYLAVKRNDSSVCHLHALDVNETAHIALPISQKEGPLWAQYVQGACKVLMSKGFALEGFDCVFGGDIPIGSGLSSSAALDCGFIKSISLLHNLQLNDWEIVDVSNESNNSFLGIQSGILDQFASVFGQESECISLDCRSREYRRHPISLGDYELILINTNVKHDHSESGYNNRPTECKRAVRKLCNLGVEIDTLRDLTVADLEEVKDHIDPMLYQRSRFIVEENMRVQQFIKALGDLDINQLGSLLYASHNGLQHLYDVSCKELDLLIDLTRHQQAVAGARMMGGGFGGCTLNLIKSTEAKKVVDEIVASYQNETNIEATVYNVQIANGVEVLNHINLES